MKRTLILGAAVLALCAAAFFVYRALRPETVDVMWVPGRSVWEHAKTLEQQSLIGSAETLALISDEAFARSLGLPIRDREPRGDGVDSTWLEGFLFPDTYRVEKAGSAREVLTRAASQFKRFWDQLVSEHGAEVQRLETELGLSEADLVVLASLVEEEMANKDEAPRIAGVFLNRLKKKMRLETDPTLMYRPDRVARKPTPTERRDRTNPYNTYTIAGLPPGPICSPGREALRAVLTSERHDYLFFVARRDGSREHAFATTLEEHERNIDRYLRKRAP
ncbi:MAG TPA: endolytic transglycosylase MltG [Myxococcota bacterium]|nr:endolytic transglycosylase MltG [Myxococcota bacterium]